MVLALICMILLKTRYIAVIGTLSFQCSGLSGNVNALETSWLPRRSAQAVRLIMHSVHMKGGLP
jgi:hypothetical protein